MRARKRAGTAWPSNSPYRRQEEPLQRDQTQSSLIGPNPQTVASLPRHLGWGSQRQTEQMRKALTRCQKELQDGAKPDDCRENQLRDRPSTPWRSPNKSLSDERLFDQRLIESNGYNPSVEEVETGWVKLHPTIGLGILRSKLAAPARVWLLLRWINKSGSGWVNLKHARHLLCDQESSLKVCSWRHLRTLLAQGEGRFWNRRDGRIWLRSIPKIAHSLQIERLSGHPVNLPINALLQSIGQIRAHFYASFHSGRSHANPISRAALRRISQVSPRSQRNYEKRTRVRKKRNYAIGPKLTDENAQNQGWLHGSACFKWHDRQGRLGKEKNDRLAWQLPNSYSGPHVRQPRGRQRQINRELAVLSAKGMTGNDHFEDDWLSRRYYDQAAQAIRTINCTFQAVYWRSGCSGRWFYLDSPGRS